MKLTLSKKIIIYVLIIAIVLAACVGFIIAGTRKENAPVVKIELKRAEIDTSVKSTVLEDGKVQLENNFVLFTFNPENYVFEVTDKSNGFVWQSSYTSNSEDKVIKGITKTNVLSHIIVNFAAGDGIKVTNSRAGSMVKDNASYELIDSGIKVIYNFGEYGFTVPVEYRVEGNGFRATIDYKEIKEEKENKILSIELLPFFGATSTNTENGYLFVPDGSGAVVDFNDKNYGIKEAYKKWVYGEDYLSPSTVQTTYDETIKVPVYGMKADNNAFFAVIESGAESAKIVASAAGQVADTFNIYSEAVCRVYNFVDVTMQNGAKSSSLFKSDNLIDGGYSVKYTLLNGEKANYVGMAEYYREYLIESGLENTATGSAELVLDLYGGVLTQESFLGIPYETVDVLTDSEQAIALLKKLKDKNVDKIALSLKNFTDSAINHKPQITVVPTRKLGGKKGIQSLVDYSTKNNVSLYPFTDIFSFSSKGNGIGSNETKVYSLEKSPLKMYDFSMVDNYRIKNELPLSFLRPHEYENAVDSLMKNAAKTELKSLSLGVISSNLISDFSGNLVSRAASKYYLNQAVEKLGNKYSLLTSSANDYLWQYSTALTDMPTGSSDYNIFSYDIPFLQIVLKGTKDYSAKALNASGISIESFLRCVEYGANIKFEGIYESNSKIKGTELANVFSANYSSWLDTACEWYSEIEAISNQVGNSKIIAHEFKDDVAVVTYDNGVKIYVNYSDEEVTIDGVTVSGLWYACEVV